MNKLIVTIVLALAAVVGVGASATAHHGYGPCEDHAPRESVVRVHLRCDHFDVHAPQRYDIVIGPKDAPLRWRDAWGGDGSLRWADRELNRHGCGRIVWDNGTYGVGFNCDY